MSKREKIDRLDERISKLLVQRLELSHDIIRRKRNLKLPVTDKDRERQIFEKVTEARRPAEKNYLLKVYKAIFKNTKKS